jgi:type II secretory pathway pseudopilin PulG
MNTIIRHLTGQKGNSLLEVLIALFLTGIITTAVLRLYVTQHQNYIAQDDVATIQQSARACIDELSRQIRMAGFELPFGVPAIVASNTNPDTITVSYESDDCDSWLTAGMASPAAELICGGDVSCYHPGQWIYVCEPDSGGGEFFEVSGVIPATGRVQHTTMSLTQAYTVNATVMALTQVKFYVDATTDPDHPKMMMKLTGQDAQVYADNISDLQIRYRITTGDIVDVPPLIEDVREVLITITGRSDQPDWEMNNGEYRTRTYASSVNVRNVGL